MTGFPPGRTLSVGMLRLVPSAPGYYGRLMQCVRAYKKLKDAGKGIEIAGRTLSVVPSHDEQTTKERGHAGWSDEDNQRGFKSDWAGCRLEGFHSVGQE